jgi:hypothetical protein
MFKKMLLWLSLLLLCEDLAAVDPVFETPVVAHGHFISI